MIRVYKPKLDKRKACGVHVYRAAKVRRNLRFRSWPIWRWCLVVVASVAPWRRTDRTRPWLSTFPTSSPSYATWLVCSGTTPAMRCQPNSTVAWINLPSPRHSDYFFSCRPTHARWTVPVFCLQVSWFWWTASHAGWCPDSEIPEILSRALLADNL